MRRVKKQTRRMEEIIKNLKAVSTAYQKILNYIKFICMGVKLGL
jgi:hypothetical protein